ncbi:hypothetical protein PIB30_094294 [Stylosanthes scabra]|uniref:Uncharacterized protein n=1 Tax=Stylosanthes scabra TaxID=79078 RepID=A0ABU6ZU75_9FABA|nr:hypothetical protein [Stylosanthes scabra]
MDHIISYPPPLHEAEYNEFYGWKIRFIWCTEFKGFYTVVISCYVPHHYFERMCLFICNHPTERTSKGGRDTRFGTRRCAFDDKLYGVAESYSREGVVVEVNSSRSPE